MEEYLIEILRGSKVKKKPFDTVSSNGEYQPSLKTIVDQMKIPIDLDTIYKDLMFEDVIKKYFPDRIITREDLLEKSAYIFPQLLKELEIKCVKEVTEGKLYFPRYDENYSVLKISVPTIENKKLKILETKTEELFSELGDVDKLPNETMTYDGYTINPDIFLKLLGRSGTMTVVCAKSCLKDISSSDLYLNFLNGHYPRDYVIFIVRLLDEVQKLSEQ